MLMLAMSPVMKGKTLSATISTYVFSANAVANDQFVPPNNSSNLNLFYVVPFDSTIVSCTISCSNDNSNNQTFDLYINDVLYGTLITLTGIGTLSYKLNNMLSIDLNQNDRLRIKSGNNGNVDSVVLTLYTKFKVT